MPAYLVGNITVNDHELWQQYVAGVQQSLIPFDATLVFRGQLDKVLAGEHHYQSVVVIEFSDQTTLDQWYESDTYQALIPIRDQAADVSIVSYSA